MSGWGTHGDSRVHQRYSQPMQKRPGRKRRCPWCRRPDGKVTHLGMANGVALTSGCEFHMAMWVRDGRCVEASRIGAVLR